MAMDHIEENDNTHAMSGINELFQVLGRAIPAACCKKVVDLVSKTGIVCMFHDCHQLDDIVAKVIYSWQHVLGKFLVGGNSLFWCRDAHVCFVHTNTFGLLGSRMLELVLFGWWRVPKVSIISWRNVHVLRHVFDPRRETIYAFAI